MMTSEKAMAMILIFFVLGAAIYVTFNKFQQDIKPAASPSPSPTLEFMITKAATPVASATQSQGQNVQGNQQQQPQPTELPFAKNKRLAQFPGILKPEILQNKKAVMQTNKGIIQIEIYPDTPKTSSNFLLLASNGFYDGLTFHRVEPGFVIQGGDPNGNGTGGPGYQFEDEPVTREYTKGTVAMANSGPNTNGSQFFIMLADNSQLPKNYTIFGHVIVGQEVVDKIAVGDVIDKVVIQELK